MPQPMITEYRAKRINSAGLRYIGCGIGGKANVTQKLRELNFLYKAKMRHFLNQESLWLI